MARTKGSKNTAESCHLMGALQLGISLDEYAEHRAAGLRWCFRCQAWQSAELFGRHSRMRDGIDTQCIEARRAYAREYQRRKRDRVYRQQQQAAS